MSKIKNKINSIINTFRMWNNADEISKISPYKIMYDMQYHFARNLHIKKYSDKFSSCFTHQDRAWFYDGTYKSFMEL